MKTIPWATLSANGNYAQATPDNPPRPEAPRDFAARATACGNFIVGRKTFEGFVANGPNSASAGLDIVVVSSRPVLVPGVTWAAGILGWETVWVHRCITSRVLALAIAAFRRKPTGFKGQSPRRVAQHRLLGSYSSIIELHPQGWRP
jgi:hypothetical protein